MKIGRINERNIGKWSLNSTPKNRNENIKKILLNKEEEKFYSVLLKINDLLQSAKNNYNSYLRYDEKDKLLQKWLNEGIISLQVKKGKYEFSEDKIICKLEKEKEIRIVKNFIEKLFPKILIKI